MAVVLPNGMRALAAPGKYRVVPPPDLNEVEDERFLFEYDFPYLIVRAMVTRRGSGAEQLEASRQAGNWRLQHPRVGGNVGGPLDGYLFNRPPSTRSRLRDHCRQFIPDISYIDERTWSHLTPEEKDIGYVPCVPTVVIEIMPATDQMENLQAKVTKFVRAGTREGVIVDTRRDRVWIYNQGQQSYFKPLAPIEFNSWPGFTLDCLAIRDARIRAGLN